jgi:hypothetical protein
MSLWTSERRWDWSCLLKELVEDGCSGKKGRWEKLERRL